MNFKYNHLNLDKIIIFFLHITPSIFLLRSAIINIHLIIISLLFFIYLFLKKDLCFLIKKYNYFLFIFWIILIISTLINDNPYIYKSIAYLRFILFALAIMYFSNHLFQKKYNYIFLINLVVILFICGDLVYQFYNGSNIFGIRGEMCDDNISKINCTRFSGIFGSELVLGGYLSLIGFLIINKFFLNNKIFIFINLILLLLIILTGERSAILLSLVFNFLLFFSNSFEKKKYLLIIITTFFVIIFSFNNPIKSQLKERFVNDTKYFFYDNIHRNNEFNDNSEFNFNKLKSSPWFLHYFASYEMIKNNLILGGGIKSFRLNCKNYDYLKNKIKSKYHVCSSHPHNFILEIIVDTGLVGLLVLMIFFILKLSLVYSKHFIHSNLISSFILVFIFLPRPTGSLFSTFFAFEFWYFLSILISQLMFKKKKIEANS